MGVQINVEDITSISLSVIYAAYLLRSKKATIFSAGKAIFTYPDLIGGPSQQDLLSWPVDKLFDCYVYVDVLLRDLPLYLEDTHVTLQQTATCRASSSWSLLPTRQSLPILACGPGSQILRRTPSSTASHNDPSSRKRNECCSKNCSSRPVPKHASLWSNRPAESARPPPPAQETRPKLHNRCHRGHNERGKGQDASSGSAKTNSTTAEQYKGKEPIRGAPIFRITPGKSQNSQPPQPIVAATDSPQTHELQPCFACFIGKYDIGLTECRGPKKWWEGVRSLLRCNHLRGHRSNGLFTKAQFKEMKATLKGAIVNGKSDHERQVRAWRKCFVIIYPEFGPLIDELNPYAGQDLLPDGRDPRKVSRELQSGQYTPAINNSSYADAVKASPTRSSYSSGSQSTMLSTTSVRTLDPTATPFEPASSRPETAPFHDPSVPIHLLRQSQTNWNGRNGLPRPPMSTGLLHPPLTPQVQRPGSMTHHNGHHSAIQVVNLGYPQLHGGYAPQRHEQEQQEHTRMHRALANAATGSQFTPVIGPKQMSEMSPSTPMTPSLLDDGQTSVTSFAREIQYSPRPQAEFVTPEPTQYFASDIHDSFGPPLIPETGADGFMADIEKVKRDAMEDTLSQHTPSLAGFVAADTIRATGSSSSSCHTEESWMEFVNMPTGSPEQRHVEPAFPVSSVASNTNRPKSNLIPFGTSLSNTSQAPLAATGTRSGRANKRPREDTPPEERYHSRWAT